MRKFLGKWRRTPSHLLLIVAYIFLYLSVVAHAQIWVTSGFLVTPSTPLGVSQITFTPGSQTESAICNTSAVSPTTGQPSPAAADYRTFLASCSLSGSYGSVFTFAQCPGGAKGSVLNYPYGNPTGQCSTEFTPQPGVTYTLTSTHALEFNLDPYGTICGQGSQWDGGFCFSDPLGYYAMNPGASNPWPPMPTYTGVSSNVSLLAMNTVDETCGARGGLCAPQDIPSQYCLSGFTLFGISICSNSIGAPEYWYLAQTSEPWQVKCSDVVQGSVTPLPGGSEASLSGAPTNISATFTPNFGYTLAQVEQVCGFSNFDWQQTITSLPLPSPFYQVGNPIPLSAPPSFNDPPMNGYTYQNPPDPVQLPVSRNPFTNNQWSLGANETTSALYYYDAPADPCLPGVSPQVAAQYCGGSTAPAGSVLAFTTHLVGIQGDSPNATVVDTGIGFSWTSTFNGTNGGIAVLSATQPVDSGSGTGGITVTAVSETSYNQCGASPLPTLLAGSQVSTTGSGLGYSRVSKLFIGTLTITNDSDSTITGLFQLVLDSLQSNVTLSNETGTFGGWPYITVPNATSLEPGQSASVTVRFSNPTDEILNYSPVVYSGSFN